jgi:hypothetical protein
MWNTFGVLVLEPLLLEGDKCLQHLSIVLVRLAIHCQIYLIVIGRPTGLRDIYLDDNQGKNIFIKTFESFEEKRFSRFLERKSRIKRTK